MIPTRRSLRRGLRAAGLAAVMAAGAWPRPPVAAPPSSRDVIVVIDVSRSMRVTDVTPDRLSVARRQVLEVLDAAVTRRVAVVAFGGVVRVICPLTGDLEAARAALAHAGDDVAPEGSRVAEALDRAAGMASPDSLVLVLSDGEPGPGPEADPIVAASRLRALGARLVVVGVGTVEGGAVPAAADAASSPHHSRLARTRLDDIAASAGGRVLQAGPDRAAEIVGGEPLPRPSIDNPAAVVAFLLLLADAALWWLAAETNPWT